MMLRTDDVGRAFLYLPTLGDQSIPPKPRTGRRHTDRLNPRAVRQIKGAALKAHNLGYRLGTFITFTVRSEDRPAFLSGQLVLGREVRRTLNALNEWLRRQGRPQLVYIWVAENKGNQNPHVHLLTSHTVPRSEFDRFATHLESLWGFGFARIERVRQPAHAGRYLMKALGYSMKGANDDQGTVIGNRYGISAQIRPKYDTIPLHLCGDAADGLRARQRVMTDDIEPLTDGVWLTRHGVAFEAGTELGQVTAFVAGLGEAVHTSD